MPGLCGLLNHSSERSFRPLPLLAALLSFFFIASSRIANFVLGRRKSRQRYPPCSIFHPLQTRPRIHLLTLLLDPSSHQKTALPFSVQPCSSGDHALRRFAASSFRGSSAENRDLEPVPADDGPRSR